MNLNEIQFDSMEAKTTTKTGSLTALLWKAWRERWTDIQWGINIKTVLPRGVSGDVYNLADCIFNQAIVGVGVNELVLSYLRHSLSAHLVSHAAVLSTLSKYSNLQRTYCVYLLLEFLESIMPGISCSGKPEETVLATAILSISSWLLNILIVSKGAKDITKKASALFDTIMNDNFFVCMICLARYNDPELFTETAEKCVTLEEKPIDNDNNLLKNVTKLKNLNVDMLAAAVESEDWPGSLIQYLLEVKLVDNPCISTSSLAKQLRLAQKLKGYENSRLYAELIRASLLSLCDVSQTSFETQWGGFAVLQVPYILRELGAENERNNVIHAIELILQHIPLLDVLDINTSCSSLQCLLGELVNIPILTETEAKYLLDKRKVPPPLKIDSETAAAIANILITAQPTLLGLLRTLSADYVKIPDALLDMLLQVSADKNFAVMLTVSTVQGQLRTLVGKLLRFNELSKISADEVKEKLFDVSFLMLVAIVQNFGANAVLDPEGNSLFEQWVRSCMVEPEKPKSSEQILRLSKPSMVETLLQQFNNGITVFKPPVNWQDLLFSMAGVMNEVLIAWEHESLSTSDVKRILTAVRGSMCSLSVASAAYLCNYIRTAPREKVLKPINMVQELLNREDGPPFESAGGGERWELTCEIIRKMKKDIQLAVPKSTHLISKQPAIEQLHSAWVSGLDKGWLSHESAKSLHCLLDIAGPRWLVSSVIREILKIKSKQQLQRAADLALAIFHVDIIDCTIELLAHILPQILYNNLETPRVMEPQILALANLTSCCLHSAFEAYEEDSEMTPKRIRLNEKPENLKEHMLMFLRQILTIFDDNICEGYMTQNIYFTYYLLKSISRVNSASSRIILGAIPSSIITNLLRTFPDLFQYQLFMQLYDVTTPVGRISMAKDLCILRNYHLKKVEPKK